MGVEVIAAVSVARPLRADIHATGVDGRGSTGVVHHLDAGAARSSTGRPQPVRTAVGARAVVGSSPDRRWAAQPAVGSRLVVGSVRWAAQPAVGATRTARSSDRPLGGPTSGRATRGSFVGSSAGRPNQRSGRPGRLVRRMVRWAAQPAVGTPRRRSADRPLRSVHRWPTAGRGATGQPGSFAGWSTRGQRAVGRPTRRAPRRPRRQRSRALPVEITAPAAPSPGRARSADRRTT